MATLERPRERTACVRIWEAWNQTPGALLAWSCPRAQSSNSAFVSDTAPGENDLGETLAFSMH